MVDTILLNGLVITMNEKRSVLQNAGVVIDKGVIQFVGSSEEIEKRFQAKKTIDCSGHIIMPGFIDAHGHAGHSFFRFVIKDTKYWMPAMTHTYFHYTTDEFWYLEARLSALERLKNGVTTGVSVLGSQPRCDSPIFAQNNAKGYSEIGIRGIVCTGPSHVPWPHNFSRWVNGERKLSAVPFEQVVKSLETVIETLNKTNNNKTFAYVTPFGIITSINPSGATPKDQLTAMTEHDKLQAREMLRIAREYHTRIHGDCFGGMLTLAKEDIKNALVGPNVHVQHCTGIYPEEIEILRDTGTHVSVAPGSGAPVSEMLDAGLLMAASTDGSKAGYGYDMFACMRQFQKTYRDRANDQILLPHERMLELVTIEAAKVVGLDDMIGSLESGKRADIITVNLKNPRLTPNFNPVHSLVMNAIGSDVDNVMVDGEFLVEDSKVSSNINESKIYDDSQKEAEETVRRAGLLNFAYLAESSWGKSRKENSPELFDLEWQKSDGGHY